jgi:hypothetical protein
VEEFKVILERHGFWHAELEEFCTAQKSLPFEDANTESNHAA